MVKTPDVKPGQVQSGQVRQGKNLQQKEGEQVKQQQANKTSSADAARLASQAGFQRLHRKKRKSIDIGDSSGAPIPLPDDDIDPDAWEQQKLDDAQGSLTLASAQFNEVARAEEGEAPLAESVVGSSFMPLEDDMEQMQVLADRPPKPVPMLDEVSNSVNALFGIELTEEVPVGQKVLAAGLVVAGESEAVQVRDGNLKEKELAGGIEKVTKRGNQAVGEAQKMSKGINKELNVQRTFVFKR